MQLQTPRRALLMIVMLAALVAACTPKVAQDPNKPKSPQLDAISVELGRLADGVQALSDTKRALLAARRISPETSAAMTDALLKVANTGKVLNDRAKTYESFDVKAKADLAKLFGDVKTAARELQTAAVIPSSVEANKILGGLDSIVDGLRRYFE